MKNLTEKYSDLISLQKAVAWLIRFKCFLKLTNRSEKLSSVSDFDLTGNLTAQELNVAL